MRIGVFTGSRANYSSSKTIIRAIHDDCDLDLVSVVGGGASLSRYGAIDKLMLADGLPKPDFVFNMYIDGESHADMAKSCGLGLMEMSTILANCDLDGLAVVGDRYDVMSAVIAAAYMNVPIIHTMGGEVTGTIDESIRHAITKFAHLHLVANSDAAIRVKRLGEEEGTIKVVGCPRMDLVKEAIEADQLTSEVLYGKYKGVGPKVDIDNDFLLVSYHPVTSETDQTKEHVWALLTALEELSMPTIMLWPNFDAGASVVAKTIRTFREQKNPSWLHLQTNFSVEDYSRLMNRTKCLLGNSSSGIREGAFLGTPVVNIGTRQAARIRANNVIDTREDPREILDAARRQLALGKYAPSALYGDGTAGPKIVQAIKTANLEVTQKMITY